MMREPTGDWERGRREHRRRSIIIFAALVSAVLSITVAMAILAVAVGKLRGVRIKRHARLRGTTVLSTDRVTHDSSGTSLADGRAQPPQG